MNNVSKDFNVNEINNSKQQQNHVSTCYLYYLIKNKRCLKVLLLVLITKC